MLLIYQWEIDGVFHLGQFEGFWKQKSFELVE